MRPRRSPAIISTGAACFRCGEPAQAARGFGVGQSRYEGRVCDNCRADFDYTWLTWQRLSQDRDAGQLRLQCALCEKAFRARRWFEVGNNERVISLCNTHVRLFDENVTQWAPKFNAVELDVILTPCGEDHITAAQKVHDRGRDGRESAEVLRAIAKRHRRKVPSAKKPVYVRLPKSWGVDPGEWHFTAEAIEKVLERGLKHEKVLLAACEPHAVQRRYESNETGLMVLSRDEGDSAVYAVVDEATCVIVDAYGPGFWAWVQDRERISG